MLTGLHNYSALCLVTTGDSWEEKSEVCFKVLYRRLVSKLKEPTETQDMKRGIVHCTFTFSIKA
jgi:hypothetical protein